MVSATSAPMRDAAGAAWPAGAALPAAAASAVAHALRRDAGGGEELLIVKGDDLRAPLGLQVALEIGRDVDSGNGVA